MNKLNTLFLLMTVFILGAAGAAFTRDMPDSSSDTCPCFDSKKIDELMESGDVGCLFNIFKIEARYL